MARIHWTPPKPGSARDLRQRRNRKILTLYRKPTLPDEIARICKVHRRTVDRLIASTLDPEDRHTPQQRSLLRIKTIKRKVAPRYRRGESIASIARALGADPADVRAAVYELTKSGRKTGLVLGGTRVKK